jgi:predicted phage-related endonuclease
MDVIDRVAMDLPFEVHAFEPEVWAAMHDDGEILTASQVAAAVGADRYTSRFALYHYKRGVEREELNDLRMAVGHALEAPIAFAFAKQQQVEVFNLGEYASIQHPDYPWLWCTPDFCTRDGDYVIPVEIKTTEVWTDAAAQWKDGEVPLVNDVQIQIQMACMGAPYAWAACIIGLGGRGLKTVRVERDDELIAGCIRMAREFLDDVRDGRAPDPTGSDTDTAILGKLISGGFKVALPDELEPLMTEWDGLSAWAKAVEARTDEIKNTLLARAVEIAMTQDQEKYLASTKRLIQIGARWLQQSYTPMKWIEAYDRAAFWATRRSKGPKA